MRFQNGTKDGESKKPYEKYAFKSTLIKSVRTEKAVITDEKPVIGKRTSVGNYQKTAVSNGLSLLKAPMRKYVFSFGSRQPVLFVQTR